jgi:hypothetical protein
MEWSRHLLAVRSGFYELAELFPQGIIFTTEFDLSAVLE